MMKMQKWQIVCNLIVLSIFISLGVAHAQSDSHRKDLYDMGILKPRDSVSTLKVGDQAPDFTLMSIGGLKFSLSQYLKKNNVVISFVPAAWTSVCSAQWPEYIRAKEMFDKNDTILLGITVDNIPTLNAWIQNICSINSDLWFPVFSDFYPHGAIAKKYGVLRSEGFTERALFLIDKKGIIRFIDIHDINKKPPLSMLKKALEDLQI
jgi:alkyl hydroperoxide reductase subunit AhpC